MQKWFEIAERNIGSEDKVITSWTGLNDEKSAHIALSKNDILLVEEH